MRFADLFVTCALAVLVAVAVTPVLVRVVGRPEPWASAVRRALWVGGLCGSALLVAQAVLVDQVADVGGPVPADVAALDWSVTHRVGWATGLGRVLALLGGPGAMAVLTAVGAMVLLIRRSRARALVVVVAGLGATALVSGFKRLYDRPRPPPTDQVIHYTNQALPSGHALGSTVIVGVLAATLVLRPGAGTAGRVAVLVGSGGFVLAVGLSRIYLAAHWLTDVLVGWLLGGAWLAVAVTALVLLGRIGASPRVDDSPPGVDIAARRPGP